MNLDDIIENENENTYLDFKMEEYKKKEPLTKDIMSMANAIGSNTKRIIIGVKCIPGEDREFIGLKSIKDQADLENIIQDNIEPTINFEYYSYNFKDHKLGIIEIKDNFDKPYMMKKDCGNLQKGDIWIRKGSRQSKATRKDLDEILKEKMNNSFNNRVIIGFGEKLENNINITRNHLDYSQFPSQIHKRKLEDLLQKLEKHFINTNNNDVNLSHDNNSIYSLNLFGEFNDSEKSIKIGTDKFGFPIYKTKNELIKSIANAENDYFCEDNYYLFEENSIKFNCGIYNDGTTFLEDVVINLFFDSKIFSVAEEIYQDPNKTSFLYDSPNYYPKTYSKDNYIVAETYHNQIRHKTRTKVFNEDLRILVISEDEVHNTIVKYTISAKNLPNPIDGFIHITIE